jgi:PleD family two-component response regulator
MPLLCEENPLEQQEKLLRDQLGRELTSREKFYLALADACAPLECPEQLATSQRDRSINTKECVRTPSLKRGKPLILCIDDDETQLSLRRQILESHGFLVLNATNTQDAVRIARETPISLVLSDHMLRGTTGTRLAAKLKRVKPDVPVVLYSGSSPKSLLNVDCFINKTEPVSRFLALICDLVDRYWT